MWWKKLGVACVIATGACATSTPDDGDGSGASGGGGAGGGEAGGGMGGEAAGHGGVGGEGGAPGGMGGQAGEGGVGGAPDNCGDRLVQAPETCDGDNFDDKECADFGLNPGVLQCNSNCQIVVSGCAPPENCNNGEDDDGDGALDCLDSECAVVAGCLDSCASPNALVIPAFEFSSTGGRPDTHAATCGTGDGSEMVFTFVAPFTGMLGISVSQSAADMQFAVSTTCGGSDVACASRASSFFFPEKMQVPITSGTTYFVMVEGTAPDEAGTFDIELVEITDPEFFCDDLWDDDYDGLVDCSDSDCAGDAFCTTGPNSVGNFCFDTGDCASVDDDAICLPDFHGFDNGYCSEFCNLAADDCPGDSLCFDYGIGDEGVCLDGCSTVAECRPGYACLDLGLGTNVCYIPPETSCTDYDDNDFDHLTDCQDDDCKATAACAVGAGAYNTPCLSHNQCASANGDDPICFDLNTYGFPNGYCSEFCSLPGNACGPDAVCNPWFYFEGGPGQCFKKCTGPADCAAGLACVNYGFGNHCNL
jgi:hypothetical protein